MNPENNLDQEICLYLASILHDVGKIRQRYEKEQNHSFYSGIFANELINLNDSNKKELLRKLVKNHHNRNKSDSDLNDEEWDLLEILKLSDRVSASHDRNDSDPDYKAEAYDIGAHMKKIFANLDDSLYRMNNSKVGESKLLRSKPLIEGINDMYPLLTLEQISRSKKEFLKPIDFRNSEFSMKKINSDLLQRINSIVLKGNDYVSWAKYFNSLDGILLNYLSFIPSAFFYDPPNITLYDHLKLTAALSNVIYKSKSRDKNAKILYIMGNSSGIQKYIFNRTVSESVDDKATKRIRGRSFYVRLYTEAIVTKILESLSLFRFNVIMQKTDGFLIMAPYSDENIQLITRIRDEIEFFSEKSNRGLKMSIAWTNSSVSDLENDLEENEENLSNFSTILEKLVNGISTRKLQYLSDQPDELFNALKPENIYFFCRKCGRSGVKNRDDTCSYCKIEENLGEKIPKFDDLAGKYIVGFRDKPALLEDKDIIKFNFGEWVYNYSIVDKKNYDISKMELEILTINYLFKENASNFRMLLQGYYSPMKDEYVISINESLKKIDKDSNGREYNYLAMNKSDVDNMGLMINFGHSNLTISKYSSTSLLLTTFFSLFSNIIAEKHNVYIIYSGGDDITALGSEMDIIDFSFEFQETFDEWVSGKMTLSTGIHLVHHKFPVLKLLDLAERELDDSKANGKDSFSIIEYSADWASARIQYDMAKRIYLNISGNDWNGNKTSEAHLGKNFLHYLLEIQKHSILKNIPAKGKKLVYPDYMISYYIRRNWNDGGKKSPKNETRENFLREILDDKVIKNLEMASTIAILKNR